MNTTDNRPWVEKYRPRNMENIVLDDLTRKLLNNIVENKNFPNLMLYGPPGTGKTTTIVNLIERYRASLGESGPGMVIHLNASDDRGVDIVRGPLSQFVSSGNMFNRGTKFVVLDEADYMTTQAQSALRQLLQSYPHIKFCLICNYVSKVDVSLRNEFVRIRFNHLPPNLIDSLLLDISKNEKLGFTEEDVIDIRTVFGSDIRSMINFIQTSNDGVISVLRNEDMVRLMNLINILNECSIIHDQRTAKRIANAKQKISNCVRDFQVRGYDVKSVLRNLVHYATMYNSGVITDLFLKEIEFIIHHKSNNTELLISYFVDECCNRLKYIIPTTDVM